jgi:hypothetical protein
MDTGAGSYEMSSNVNLHPLVTLPPGALLAQNQTPGYSNHL